MMLDGFAKGFAGAVADIRHKVLEEGWFGKAVTSRAQTITLGSATDDLSPAERLGWLRRDERAHGSPADAPDHEAAAKEPKAPERGIDL